jgi:hypothetical protein
MRRFYTAYSANILPIKSETPSRILKNQISETLSRISSVDLSDWKNPTAQQITRLQSELNLLSWSHYVTLLSVTNPDERSFYEIESAANDWSLRELNLIEQWGSGIPSVLQQAQALGLEPIKIEEFALRMRFAVPLLEAIPLRSRVALQATDIGNKETGAQPESQPESQTGAQSGAQSDEVLSCLAHEPFSANELAQLLGVSGVLKVV